MDLYKLMGDKLEEQIVKRNLTMNSDKEIVSPAQNFEQDWSSNDVENKGSF